MNSSCAQNMSYSHEDRFHLNYIYFINSTNHTYLSNQLRVVSRNTIRSYTMVNIYNQTIRKKQNILCESDRIYMYVEGFHCTIFFLSIIIRISICKFERRVVSFTVTLNVVYIYYVYFLIALSWQMRVLSRWPRMRQMQMERGKHLREALRNYNIQPHQ